MRPEFVRDVARQAAVFESDSFLREALGELSSGWPVLVKVGGAVHLLTPADVVGHSPSRRLLDLPLSPVYPLAADTPVAAALAECGDADFVVVAPAAGLSIASRLMLLEAVLAQAQVTDALPADAAKAILEILDQTRDGVVLIAPDASLRPLNTMGDKALRTMGVTAAEVAEGRFGGVPLDAIVQDARRGTPRDIEVSEPVRRMFSVRAVGTGAGPDGLLLLLRDVTHIRHRQAREAAMERMVLLGEVTCGVAHDLNNVLTVVTGVTSLLQGEPESTPETQADLALIEGAVTRAAGLVRQLVAFGRRELTQPEPLNTVAVVRELEDMLRRIAGPRVRIAFTLDPGLPWILADTVQIERILSNLVVNARNAMPAGGEIRVDVHAEPGCPWLRRAPGQTLREGVRISVADTGSGMDAATAARIFEPYFTTSAGRGAGLGLATVHATVDRLGGHVTVESQPGVGTRFDIFLPAADRQQVQEAPQLVRRPARPGRMSGTLLLVEDDPGVSAMVTTLLERRGYAVTAVETAAEAHGRVDASGEPDLLITEVSLPGTSGLELARSLCGRFPGLRVLVLSGHAVDGIRYEVRDPDFEYLTKPFGAGELFEKVGDLAGVGGA